MKKNLLWILVVILLVGCSAAGRATPTPLPTVILGESQSQTASQASSIGGLAASGVIVPAQEAEIGFALAGKVEDVLVKVGEEVKAGQELVRLEGQEELVVAISAARFEQEQAQQALADLNDKGEAARVQAMQEIVTYEKAVRDAQYALDNFTVPNSQANLDAVEALNQMKQRLDQARLAFEPYKYETLNDPIREDLKDALDAAQADYNAAVRRLQLEYDLEVAESQLNQAQKDYEILKAGADPDQVRLAEARQAQAEDRMTAAQAALGCLTLVAPFDGTVAKLNVQRGEWVLPGQPVLVLADLQNLQVETSDLSERDVPGVELDQPVTVFIRALNEDVNGRVIAIAPLADTLGGDVVYQITIELEELPEGLRAGMSVEVRF
jgi:multidrug efflux pump subunit AcrA (membrane-fusion protein)